MLFSSFIILFIIIAAMMMADATTPALRRPTTAFNTAVKQWQQPRVYNVKRNPHHVNQGKDLEATISDGDQEYGDPDATVDTAATTGEFFIELLNELNDLTELPVLKPLGLDIGWVPYKPGDYYVLTGTIASGPLQRNEELTLDDSSATLQLVYGASYADGADRVIVARLTSGPITVDDAVAVGGTSSGTLTFAAGADNLAGGANNRCPGIGGRLKTVSTGAAYAGQTSVPVWYDRAVGTKVSA